jgi:hypothetical protein
MACQVYNWAMQSTRRRLAFSRDFIFQGQLLCPCPKGSASPMSSQTRCIATRSVSSNWQSMDNEQAALSSGPNPLGSLAAFPLGRSSMALWKRASFSGGQSNPTYAIFADGAPRLVLRKKPPGVLLRSAHAIEREVSMSLPDALKRLPQCRSLGRWRCARIPNRSSARPFFVMEYVSGRNFWEAHFCLTWSRRNGRRSMTR